MPGSGSEKNNFGSTTLSLTTCSVTTRLLELYQECVNNNGWARVLYEARGGTEKLTFIRNLPPASPSAAPPQPRQPGRRPASERRRARQEAEGGLGREEA